MKYLSLSRWAVVLALCMLATAACSNKDDPEPEPGSTSEDITAKITDPVFRAYCLANFDTDKDGKLRADEAAAVKEINVSVAAASGKSVKATGDKISSLAGLEWFTALEKLFAANNNLTTLDVSKNTKLTTLEVSGNQLTALDVTKNTALVVLIVSNNKIAALDVSKNTALTELNIGNNLIVTIDLGTNTALAKLYVNDNKLTELDIEANTKLTVLVSTGNDGLTVITVWEGFDKSDPPSGFEPGDGEYLKPGEEKEPILLLESVYLQGFDRPLIAKYEYDEKNRLIRIYNDGYYDFSTTLTYDSSGEISTIGSTNITKNDNIINYGINTYELNNKGLPIIKDTPNYTWEYKKVTYTYDDYGNVIRLVSKLINASIGDEVIVYEYDKQKSPFYKCATPKWYLVSYVCNFYYVGSFPPILQMGLGYHGLYNNPISNGDELSRTNYTYTYNEEGYPISKTGSDGYYKLIYNYIKR